VDYLGYGGIYREVRLEILEEQYIKSCFLTCGNIDTNIVTADIETSSVNEGIIEVSVYDKDKQVCFSSVKLDKSCENFVSIDSVVNNKILWSINNPYLYDVKVTLLVNDEIKDETNNKFGFREAKFTKNGFFLNKERIKLRGLNRHQSYPYVGYAMPKSAQEKDADILKYDLGVNIVRTSHYMQSKHFLNRCDEIGLLVLEEIPGWQHIGNEQFKKNSLRNVYSMITRDYNHPSIILWGVRINESPDDDDLYKQTNQIAHSLDKSRQTCGIRNFVNSNMFEDVYTFNDFIHSGGKDILRKPNKVKRGVPYLVTEFNGHMFPTKRFDDESHRVEHALRHLRVINEAVKNDRISGTIGWCMNDYNTHQQFGSGDKICYHGVLDMYRLPKYASYIYSSQQDDIPVLEVLSTLNYGDYSSGVLEKAYAATNLDYIKLFKNDEYIDTFYPDKDSNLLHPIIVIDDFIGKQLEEKEGFSKRDSKRCKKIFATVTKYGYNLPLRYKITMLMVLLNNKLKLNDASNIFFKYYTGNFIYRFEGYKNNQIVKVVKKENIKDIRYKLDLDKNDLQIGNTYDVLRAVVTKADQNGNLLPYSFDPLIVEVSGGIDLIGPNQLALNAGAIAFWVKTNGKDDHGIIKVRVENNLLTETIIIK